MRPFQNNKKVRRSSNGRRGANPMSRSYESSGPDVKIRGTASHVAEKYMSLARDAQSAGDSVMSENYLQHAEHYFRVIAGYQQQPSSGTAVQPLRNGHDDDIEDTADATSSDDSDVRNSGYADADNRSERDDPREIERNRPRRTRPMRGGRGNRNNHDGDASAGNYDTPTRTSRSSFDKDDQPDITNMQPDENGRRTTPSRRPAEKRSRPSRHGRAVNANDHSDDDTKPKRNVSLGDNAALPGFVSTAIPRLEEENR